MDQVTSVLTLVSQYSHQTAQRILSSLDAPPSHDVVFSKVLSLVQDPSRQPIAGGLTPSILQDIAVIAYAQGAYDSGSNDLLDVQKTFDLALRSSSKLRDEFGNGVLQAFGVAFSLGSLRALDASKISLLRRTSYCLLALLSVLPESSLSTISNNTPLLVSLGKAYDALSTSSSFPTKAILSIKVHLLDSVHVMFEQTRTSSSSPSQLLDLIYPLLDLPSSTPSSSTKSPFMTRGLLGDYEATFALSSQLDGAAYINDPRFEFVRGQLRALAGRTSFADNAKALAPLLALHTQSPAIKNDAPADTKGKGKAKALDVPEQPQGPKTDHSVAISQILDILPDEDPAFLHRALEHPAYAGNPEALLGALLEGGSLPGNLDRVRRGEVSVVESEREVREEKVDLLASRRNVFEDQPLDFSRLTLGKNRRENADTVLQDKTFTSDYKAEILRRAREQVEEEEEAERAARAGVLGSSTAGVVGGVRTVAFAEELSDVDDELEVDVGAARLKVGDGDASGEEDAGDAKTLAMIEEILEVAYLKDPKLFDRDANTKRSKARADLRAETGWDDGQLEGWRVMLDRNPHKDRILAKHEFSGNRTPRSTVPNSANASGSEGPESSSRGRGRGQGQGGRGGRGAGRGRGGNGGGAGGSSGGNTERDRARKDKAGNQQRRRGHDKKMARGGFPPVA